MILLDKDTITEDTLPFLPQQKRGFPRKVTVYQIINAILYKLKSGCQWRMLPVNSFFEDEYSWQNVYYHFRKWATESAWQEAWRSILSKHRSLLDMSSIQLDDSHTPAKGGGQEIAYQGRKKSKTTNILLLTDSQGIPIACSNPVSGNHNDAIELEKQTQSMINHLKYSNLRTGGLFLNADARFDVNALKNLCFKEDIFANIPQNRRGNKQAIGENILMIPELYVNRIIKYLNN